MAVKEYPILFSTPMVNAILEERKSQTRRVVKPQPKVIHVIYTDKSLETNCIFRKVDQRIHCPYGQVNSKLWVKETFVIESDLEYVGDNKLPTDRPIKTVPDDGEWGEYHLIPHYRATEPEPNIVSIEQEDFDDRTRWKPSIFMPRWASRITLEITDIRVERVQEITPEDVMREGVIARSEGILDDKHEFSHIWDDINSKRKVDLCAENGHTVYIYSWVANPFVWVISFKRIK